MAPHVLTALAPIRPGEDSELRATLRRIGDDINGDRLSEPGEHVHIDFPRSRSVHFARLALLADPDRGPDCWRLLVATIYDGDLDRHLHELLDVTSDADAIFSHCLGYEGRDRFEAFIRDHSVEPASFYIAFPDETAERLRGYVERRRELEKRLDAKGEPPPAGRSDGGLPARSGVLLGWMARLARAVVGLVGMILRFGPFTVVKAARKITATLDRLWYARLFNFVTRNRHPRPPHPYSEIDPDGESPCQPGAAGDEITSGSGQTIGPRREDVVAQNQLTLVTVTDPARLKELRAVQAVMELYFRCLAPPGSLAGISTIHFARWLVIDGGKRLLFMSDYDGSWEAYIDEFTVMILSGLDAIWGSAIGCPGAGAQDVPAFKRFLRCHQVQSEIYYSAYPAQTVLNVLDNRKVLRNPQETTA